jgi:hypothetical protein
VVEETDTGRDVDLLLVDARYDIEREGTLDARLGGLSRDGGSSDGKFGRHVGELVMNQRFRCKFIGLQRRLTGEKAVAVM